MYATMYDIRQVIYMYAVWVPEMMQFHVPMSYRMNF